MTDIEQPAPKNHLPNNKSRTKAEGWLLFALLEIAECIPGLVILGLIGDQAYNYFFRKTSTELTQSKSDVLKKRTHPSQVSELFEGIKKAEKSNQRSIAVDDAIYRYLAYGRTNDYDDEYYQTLEKVVAEHPVYFMGRTCFINEREQKVIERLAHDPQIILSSIKDTKGRDYLSGPDAGGTYYYGIMNLVKLAKLTDAKTYFIALSEYPHGESDLKKVRSCESLPVFADKVFYAQHMNAIVTRNPLLVVDMKEADRRKLSIAFDSQEVQESLKMMARTNPITFLDKVRNVHFINAAQRAEYRSIAIQSIDGLFSDASFLHDGQSMKREALRFVEMLNNMHDMSNAERFANIKGLSPKTILHIIHNASDEVFTSTLIGMSKELYQSMERNHIDFSAFMNSQEDYKALKHFVTVGIGYGQEADILERFPDKPTCYKIAIDIVQGLDDVVNRIDSDESDSNLAQMASMAEAVYNLMTKPSRLQSTVEAEVMRIFNTHTHPVKKALYGYLISADLSRFPEKYFGSVLRSFGESHKYALPVRKSLDVNKLFKNNICAQRVYFYAGLGGDASFNSFMDHFRRHKSVKWVIDDHKDFVVITNEPAKPSGRRIVMVANHPNATDSTTLKILKYASEKGLEFTVGVHRSHSYDIKDTYQLIKDENLTPDLFLDLGCGGAIRATITQVVMPKAQLIVTSQVGKANINNALQSGLNNELLKASDELIWAESWPRIMEQIGSTDKGAYTSPESNLSGLIFNALKEQIKIHKEFLLLDNRKIDFSRQEVRPIRIGHQVFSVV